MYRHYRSFSILPPNRFLHTTIHLQILSGPIAKFYFLHTQHTQLTHISLESGLAQRLYIYILVILIFITNTFCSKFLLKKEKLLHRNRRNFSHTTFSHSGGLFYPFSKYERKNKLYKIFPRVLSISVERNCEKNWVLASQFDRRKNRKFILIFFRVPNLTIIFQVFYVFCLHPISFFSFYFLPLPLFMCKFFSMMEK